MEQSKGPFLVTLRVDSLDYDEIRERYSITLHNCVLSQHNKMDDHDKESTESIKFEVSDPSKIVRTERAVSVPDEAGLPDDEPLTADGSTLKSSRDGVLMESDRYFLIFWAVYIVIAILLFMVIEGDSFVDAFYFRIVTSFGVGYGDICPQTVGGKILNCMFIVIDLAKMAYIDWRILTMLFKYRQHRHHVDTLSVRNAPHPHTAPLDADDDPVVVLESNRFAKLVNNPHFLRYILLMLFLWFFAGTLMMALHEGYSVLDALEWNFVTISQVGYGNVVPQTIGGQLFTVFYIIFGYVLLMWLAVIIFDVALGKLEKRRSSKLQAKRQRDAKVELTGLLSQ